MTATPTPEPIDHHLQECRKWSQAKLDVPPEELSAWFRYHYNKLFEASWAIEVGRQSAAKRADLLGWDGPP